MKRLSFISRRQTHYLHPSMPKAYNPKESERSYEWWERKALFRPGDPGRTGRGGPDATPFVIPSPTCRRPMSPARRDSWPRDHQQRGGIRRLRYNRMAGGPNFCGFWYGRCRHRHPECGGCKLEEQGVLPARTWAESALCGRCGTGKTNITAASPAAAAHGHLVRLAAAALHPGRRAERRRAGSLYPLYNKGLIDKANYLVNRRPAARAPSATWKRVHQEVDGKFISSVIL